MTVFKNLITDFFDPIYGLQAEFLRDSRINKINLGIGVITDQKKNVYPFQTVESVIEKLCIQHPARGYLPIRGDSVFCQLAQKLVFGKDIAADSLLTVQTIGATGALFLLANLLYQVNSKKPVFISNPTWINHESIFQNRGFSVYRYPYVENGVFSFQTTYDYLSTIQNNAIVLFQASCHNPTGYTFTEEQWDMLALLAKDKQFFCIFDLSYQGLGTDLDTDAYPIRKFFTEGIEIACATTFAKNFSLYNARIGALSITTKDNTKEIVGKALDSIIRTTYSSPPLYGAQIVRTILETQPLYMRWKEELANIQKSLQQKRKLFTTILQEHCPQIDTHTIEASDGLFSLLHITSAHVQELKEKHALYLCSDGRINIASLQNEDDMYTIAKILHTVLI